MAGWAGAGGRGVDPLLLLNDQYIEESTINEVRMPIAALLNDQVRMAASKGVGWTMEQGVGNHCCYKMTRQGSDGG